ncbi:MAG: phosphoribosylglycinamide formyltransferase [Candidatus Altiarchaeales archaeon ex4484_2]|nr:MAG: phosphoribosylglycinamide formyltransferase [Candidatus Altiarchaeales archaeon ex4484_2]
MSKLRIGVLASTRGTDLQAIIDEIEAGRLDAEVSIVLSNKEDAYALTRARKHGIKAVFLESKGKTREEFDREMMELLENEGVEVIALIGYMRLLSPEFVQKYMNRIMNVHPSLLPAFAGGMDENVHKTILEHGVKVSGATIHFVDEGADTGPIILQEAVPVTEDETVDSLKEKVQAVEKKLFPKALGLFHQGRLRVEGRRVRIMDGSGK